MNDPRLALEHRKWHADAPPLEFFDNVLFYDCALFRPMWDEFLKERGVRAPDWQGGRFVVALTYDLDSFDLRIEAIRKMLRGIRRRDVRTILSGMWWSFAAKGATDLPEHLSILREYRLKATFFVPSIRRSAHPVLDARDPCFFLDDAKALDLLFAIKEEGHELGLHPTIHTSLSPDSTVRLREEKSNLETSLGLNVVSLRHHWLMFDPEKNAPSDAEAGFLYDSSYGYNRCPGFRAGTSYPFRMGNLLELPLIMQDGALFGGLASGGLGLSLDRGCELAKFLIDRVREVGGVLTVLCHPTSNKQAGKMRREWIRRIIEHALAEGARFLTIAEIGEMWRRIGGGIEQFMQGIDAQDFFAWLESRGLCAG